MRDVVLQMMISIDGFIGGEDGDLSWALRNVDDEFTEYAVDGLSRAGVHVMGGASGKGMAEHWPHSTAPTAQAMNEIPKVVFSKSFTELDWNATRVTSNDVAKEISALKQEPGGYIFVHGGAAFARSMAAQDLIDEYRLVVHPVALGRGLPLFQDLPTPLDLSLAECRPFSSGAVLHVYRSNGAGADAES